MLMSAQASCYFMALTEHEFSPLLREDFPNKKYYLREWRVNLRMTKKFGSCTFVRYPYLNVRFRIWRSFFLRAIESRIKETMRLHTHEGRLPDRPGQNFIDRVALRVVLRRIWRIVKGDFMRSRLPEDQDLGLNRLFNQYF